MTFPTAAKFLCSTALAAGRVLCQY